MRFLSCTLAAALLVGAAISSLAQSLPRRAFVGINLRPITDSIQHARKLPGKNGILVTGVRPQSSAEAAKLQANDVVLRLDDQEVRDVPHFVGLLKQYKVGDKSTLTLLRNGKTMRQRLVFIPYPTETSPRYTVEYGSVHAGPNHLRTLVTRPVGVSKQAKVPLVLIIQGVGCYSIDNPLIPDDVTRRMVDSLSRHGYATMRVDKTGMGDSQGTPCQESTFRMEADGYKAGLAAIQKLAWVDQHNIFLTGFSIGGILAPLVAEGAPIKGIVTWGTASRTFIEYLLQNKRYQSELAGMPYDQLNRQQQLYAAVLHLLLTEKQTPAQVLAKYPNAGDLLRFPQHYTYMQQWQDANLAEAWKKLDTNVLVLRGEADFISYNEDQQLIVDIVNREHPGRATFQLLPNVDHGFTRARTPLESMQLGEAPNPEKNFEFMNVIVRWLDDKQKQRT
ncbi:alpha/beta hydrolase family protein [Solirubrum puertoriconensis]|nr:alpha/beta fold hydrolase [Solirubrum puertoriconensis]